MAVQLNHTILEARDRDVSAGFLADILGVARPVRYDPFLVVQLSNEVSLDVLQVPGPVASQHYAFLVTEAEFDGIFDRIRRRGLTYWADPFHRQPGRINQWHGGRGVYFDDPDGHRMEIITRPYEIGV